jgi:ATP-binding cassette subfamily B protein RaxB
MLAVDLLNAAGRARTPYIPQTEAAECGLACLAMIAGHHGLKTDLAALRQKFSMSLRGVTLAAIADISRHLGFNSRSIRCDVEDLSQLPLPAILHWDFNHFVVLSKVRIRFGQRHFLIHDPARGRHWCTLSDLSRHFTGVALELVRSASFTPRTDRETLRLDQFWSRISGLVPALGNILVLSIIIQIMALAAPFYMRMAIDSALPSSDKEFLFVLSIGFGALALFSFVTTWTRSILILSFSSSMSFQIVVNLYQHLLNLPLSWFEKRNVGDIISRFNATTPITDLINQGFVAAIVDGILAISTIVLLFLYSTKLALLAVATLCLFALLKALSFRSIRLRNVDAITAAARESGNFIESVRGIAAIKAFGQERNREIVWNNLRADTVNANISLGRTNASVEAGGQLILGLDQVIFVFIAAGMAMDGVLSLGMIFAIQAYRQQFMSAATRLIDFGIRYKVLDVHLSRVSDIALSRPEILEDRPIGVGSASRGGIELRNVVFRYGAYDPDILQAVNLKIEPGEMAVLVGPSGGGKTTLIKLMMGLIEPVFGAVSIDGEQLTMQNRTAWRKHIGCVSQEDTLYAGSIADNISFFDPDRKMERIIEVAKIATIHELIEQMPLKYDTLVGDMGSTFSGGQRQRLFLARALYPNPSVLFLDEATAHLDPQAERTVMAAIASLSMTRVISAHRPGSIDASARKILVAGGKVHIRAENPPG